MLARRLAWIPVLVAGLASSGCIDQWLAHPTPRKPVAMWSDLPPDTALWLQQQTRLDVVDQLILRPDANLSAMLGWLPEPYRKATLERAIDPFGQGARLRQEALLTSGPAARAWLAEPDMSGGMAISRSLHLTPRIGGALDAGDPAESDPDRIAETSAPMVMDLSRRARSGGEGNLASARAALAAGQSVVLFNPPTAAIPDVLAMLEAHPGQAWLLLGNLTTWQRVPEDLQQVLERVDLYPQYRYASAYPVPAINASIWLGRLARYGFIARSDVTHLRRIFAFHPLWFDLALMRSLRLPGTAIRLPDAVFGPLQAGPGT